MWWTATCLQEEIRKHVECTQMVHLPHRNKPPNISIILAKIHPKMHRSSTFTWAVTKRLLVICLIFGGMQILHSFWNKSYKPWIKHFVMKSISISWNVICRFWTALLPSGLSFSVENSLEFPQQKKTPQATGTFSGKRRWISTGEAEDDRSKCCRSCVATGPRSSLSPAKRPRRKRCNLQTLGAQQQWKEFGPFVLLLGILCIWLFRGFVADFMCVLIYIYILYVLPSYLGIVRIPVPVMWF